MKGPFVRLVAGAGFDEIGDLASAEIVLRKTA